MAATQVRLGVLKLVGIRVTGSREDLVARVPKAWRELAGRVGEIEGVVDPDVFYGVVPEGDHHKLAGEGTYTYLCCVRVKSGGKPPKGMESLIVPAQRYAQATVQGGAAEVTRAYLELARYFAENQSPPNKKAFGLERFETKRQSVLAPAGRYDYDVLRPLLPQPSSSSSASP
jgi:predicted transcriptional regulator YdeE